MSSVIAVVAVDDAPTSSVARSPIFISPDRNPEFRVPPLGHKNVGRLDIAMHDAFGVGGIKRIRDLSSQREDFSISIG